MEKVYEHRTSGFLAFIDLRKAYDSVSRTALWRGLELLGVPHCLINILTSFHEGMSAKVRVGTGHTNQIPVNNGLRQGCSIAPVLFNLFFMLVLEKWHAEMDKLDPDHGVSFRFNINGNLFNGPRTSHQSKSTDDLEFADDAILISTSRASTHTALTTFAAVATSFGLTVNFIKTKFMACGVGISDDDRQPLVIGNEEVLHVDTFVYLGSLVSSNSRVSAEVDRRLASASRCFGMLQCIFNATDLSINTKRLVYNACVLSTLLYGAECWPILRRDEIRLDAFHHRCLRAILGVTRLDQQARHIRNEDIRQRWGDVGTVTDMLRKRRLQWLGHVARMPADRLPPQLLFGWLEERRPAHGPRLRWKDRISADLKALSVRDWFHTAQERQQWREVCHTVPDTQHLVSASATCAVCHRTFKSHSGLARHKCASIRQLPVQDQPGSRQCPNCLRWFKSAGGLAVHKCRDVHLNSATASPSQPINVDQRSPAISSQCCTFHCTKCDRCFKSGPGFNRHNCDRGKNRATDRSSFTFSCSTCNRRFRRNCDLKRHKCR